MTILRRCLFAVACGAGLSGCHPWYTRVPDLVPRTSEHDKALSNYQNPFPDELAGPSVDHRPPGFERQRTMSRHALETRSITDSISIKTRDPSLPPRPEARLNPKTANVVQP